MGALAATNAAMRKTIDVIKIRTIQVQADKEFPVCQEEA